MCKRRESDGLYVIDDDKVVPKEVVRAPELWRCPSIANLTISSIPRRLWNRFNEGYYSASAGAGLHKEMDGYQ